MGISQQVAFESILCGSLEIDIARKFFGKLFPWVFRREGTELASGITVLIAIIVLLWENEYVREILLQWLWPNLNIM